MKCPECNKELGNAPLLFCPDCFSPLANGIPSPTPFVPKKKESDPIQNAKLYLEEKFSQEKRDIYSKRRSGITLEELGKEYGVTKERIRQICLSVEDKCAPLANAVFRKLTEEKDYVEYSEITSLVSDSTISDILVGTMASLSSLEDLPYAETIMVRGNDSHDAAIRLMASELVGELENVEEKKDEILSLFSLSGYPFISWKNFKRLLMDMGYRSYGKYASKGFLSISDMCMILMKKFFPQGISLTQVDDKECKDMDILRSLLYSEFGVEKKMRNRILYSSANRDNNLVLVDRSKFLPSDSLALDDSVLERIRKEIEDMPESQVYFCTLFDSMAPWLKENSPIDNHYFLHGVISLHFSSLYSIRRDYLLKGSGASLASYSTERIVNALQKNGTPMSYSEIKSLFPGFSDPMIAIPLSKSRVVCLDDKKYSLPEWINLDGKEEEVKKAIRETIRKNGGYSNAPMLHASLVSSLPLFVSREHLDSPQAVFGLASAMMDDEYDFNYPHLSEKGKYDISSYKTLMLQLFPSYSSHVVSYSQFFRDAESIQMKDVTAAQTFRSLFSSYKRINDDQYMRNEEFMEKEGKTIGEMEAFLSKKTENGYFSFLGFLQFPILPPSPLPWNQFLLETIVSLTSFSILRIGGSDRRVSRIIVAKSGLYSSYSDLVGRTMEEKGIVDGTREEIESLLSSLRLVPGTLPSELFSSGTLAEEDGIIYLRAKRIPGASDEGNPEESGE